ncbi:hypothetical protein V8C40DRAFT_245780 [Trichoderma camerunense]
MEILTFFSLSCLLAFCHAIPRPRFPLRPVQGAVVESLACCASSVMLQATSVLLAFTPSETVDIASSYQCWLPAVLLILLLQHTI